MSPHAAAARARWAGVSLAAFTLLVLPPVAHAYDLTAFMSEQGHGDLSISNTFEWYEDFWVGDDKVSDPGVGRVETGSLSLWLNWGLHERITLVASLAYVDANSDGMGGFAESGLQDRAVLAKVRLSTAQTGSVLHSFGGALGVRSPASGYEANSPVDIGDGTTDGLFRFLYLLQSDAFYWSQQIGYDIRGEDAPDGIPIYTEIGYTVSRVTPTVFYSGYLADGGTDIGDPGFTFPSNGDEFHRVGAKLFAWMSDDFGISLSAMTTLEGRNTGEASGMSAGITVGL
jgi:hypothetical protein